MFVDDGHRASHELIEGRGPRRSSDKCVTAGAFALPRDAGQRRKEQAGQYGGGHPAGDQA
jgi:hypothetical protein